MTGRLYQLPLTGKPERPLRLAQRRAAQAEAPEAGLAARQTPLWYAVALPQLLGIPDEQSRKDRLTLLADRLGTLSATVSVEAPDCLVFEARSSLRYFGGIGKLRALLQQLLEPVLSEWGLPVSVHHAASPTPAASLLLARAGCNLLIHRKENLRSALGRLSVQSLSMPASRRRQLHDSGLRSLRDVWRLPGHALGQRFGTQFLRQLDQCLGRIASPVRTYQSPPRFNSSLEFEYAVETTQRLLPAVEELLERLCSFLRARDLSTLHLHLSLLHESQSPTLLTLDMRHAGRAEAPLLLLLETRLSTLALPAPVSGMQLEAWRFKATSGSSHSLAGFVTEGTGRSAPREAIAPLLTLLQARLGDAAVRSLQCHEEHCPEHAAGQAVCGQEQGEPGSGQTETLQARRPCWLLPEPVLLRQDNNRLFYRGSLRLRSGPERIETRWWTGQEVCRDYYVADNARGMRLWIFHEREGERRWFLHGIFD
jgi:protein ImuB